MEEITYSYYRPRFVYYTCGARTLHIPKHPSMKHSFTKMLYIIALHDMCTRQEIFASINNDPLLRETLNYGVGCFDAWANNDYWADLFHLGYIKQFKEGKKIRYSLAQKSIDILRNLPDEEKLLLKYNKKFA